MIPAILDRQYTVDEFEQMPGANGFELVDGHLVEKAVGNEADFVSGNLFLVLAPFVRERKLGFVQTSEAGYVLFPGDLNLLRKPDVSFVARGRYPNDRPTRGYARFAPDFAFETVSPSDFADEVQGKVEEYLRAGVRLVWVAFPKTQIVLAFRPDGSVRRYGGVDPLTADELFPGFSVPTSTLFAVD